ncbi:hypothetical protein ES705_49988 [subsurface metagenome]
MEKEVVDFDRFGTLLGERKEKIEGGFKMKTFNEDTFLKNKPEWEKDLFRKINNFLLNEIKKGVVVNYLETYTRYSYNNLMFVRVISTLVALKIYLKLRFSEVENPQKWVRDYAKISRQTWVEITIREADLITEETIILDNIFDLVKQAFNWAIKYPKLSKVSVGKPEKILPEFVTPTKMKIGIEISTDGFCQLGIRVHKSRLTKILEKLIE